MCSSEGEKNPLFGKQGLKIKNGEEKREETSRARVAISPLADSDYHTKAPGKKQPETKISTAPCKFTAPHPSRH